MAAPARDAGGSDVGGRQGYLSDASGFGARTLGGVPANGAGALQARPAGADRAVRRLEHGCRARQCGRDRASADQWPEAGRVHGGRSAVPALRAGQGRGPSG